MSEAESVDQQTQPDTAYGQKLGELIAAFEAYVRAEIRYAEILEQTRREFTRVLSSALGLQKETQTVSETKVGGWSDKAQMLLSSPWGDSYKTGWDAIVPGAIVTVSVGKGALTYTYWWQKVDSVTDRPDGRKDFSMSSAADIAMRDSVTVAADAVQELVLHDKIGGPALATIVRTLPCDLGNGQQ